MIFSFSEVIGPSLGTLMVDLYDFPTSMTTIGLMNLTVAGLVFIHWTTTACRRKEKTVAKQEPTTQCNVVHSKMEAVEFNAGDPDEEDQNESSRLLMIDEEQEVTTSSYGAVASSF